MKKWLRKVSALALVAGLLGSNLSLNSLRAQELVFEGEAVSIGVVGDEYAEVWEYVSDKAHEEEGIELDVILFTDFNIPNEALADGSIDLNAFQHDVFLENWNTEQGENLITIGYTVAVPTRIYSDKYQSLDDLPEGATIAVNSAPTSLSYNLQTLERAGLITLSEDEILPTPNDIVDNPKKLNFVELDAAQIPAAVPDVDAAFIDNSFLGGTDFLPTDAIYVFGDTPETLNIDRVNNIVAREEDQTNPLYLKIVELYQTEDVAEKIEEVTLGGSIPAWDLVAEALAQ